MKDLSKVAPSLQLRKNLKVLRGKLLLWGNVLCEVLCVIVGDAPDSCPTSYIHIIGNSDDIYNIVTNIHVEW